MITTTILETVEYVSAAPYFVNSMGAVCTVGMFVGAYLYRGRLSEVLRALVAVKTYAIILLWINFSRIAATCGLSVGHAHDHLAFAGIATIILTSCSWLLGLLIGTLLIKIHCRKSKKGINDTSSI